MSINSTKRKRQSESMSENSLDKHQSFMQWSKDQGVEINGIKPAQIQGRGLGLVATKKLTTGERLLLIPEKAMFKPDAILLKKESLSHLSPQAQLAVSAMLAYEPESSRLKLWQSTWPTLDDFTASMPMCWTATEQEQLPPSVHQPLDRQLADYNRDWTAVESFCTRSSLAKLRFKYYWMIVNSRSFHWKPPRAKAGCMVMCPFIDYLNHGPSWSTCRVTMTEKGYEVTADRKYAYPPCPMHSTPEYPGEEILVTYGAHSNDKLLVHYGFICSPGADGPSPDDDIRLDHLILPQMSAEVRAQLQDVGFLGGYALLPAKNELCFKTQVAVRAVLLTCNEWEYFVASGEDLSVDYTAEVDAYVKALLVEYRKDALRHSGAPGMVGLRWKQIIDAIDAFSHD